MGIPLNVSVAVPASLSEGRCRFVNVDSFSTEATGFRCFILFVDSDAIGGARCFSTGEIG
jgi:hypothetical protein